MLKGGETVKEQVFIQIYQNNEYVTEQDVSGFSIAQITENIRIKEKHGLECRIKRVFIKNG